MANDIRIGPAGWSYSDWKGVVYPASREPGFHEAEYLSRYFSTIELNSSYYRPPRPETARVWVKKLAGRPRFQFTAKLYRGFTHDRKLDREAIRDFCAGIEPLIDAEKLGCILMQFPMSFRRTQENQTFLRKLASAFGQYPLVAELRHVSWNVDEALAALADGGIGFCNIDQPQFQQCLPPTAHVTSSIGYVRLHGRNYEEWFRFDDEPREGGRTAVEARYDYLYSWEQLEKWKARIDQIAKQAETTYVITNNHFEGKAVVNALQLLALETGERVEAPPTLLEHYPELNQAARNLPEQRSLFFERRGPGPRRIPPRPVVTTAVYARA